MKKYRIVTKASYFLLLRFTIVLIFFSFFTSCQKEKTTLVWQEKISPKLCDWRAIHFSSTQNGIICGGNTWTSGWILRTKDGGTTWQADSILNKGFYGLGTEGGNVWIVGNSGHVFEFSKNDSVFRWVGEPYDAWFRDIAVAGHTGLMVAGQAFRNGKLVRFDLTTGQKWQLDTFPQELSSVCFSDSTTAHVVGYGLVLRSIDGGKTWQPHNDLLGDFFQSIYFVTDKVGYIVGLNGGILKTTDSGTTWSYLKKSRTIGNPRFRSVFFSDALRGWICGEGGVLWHTTDGGESWKVIDNMPNVDFYDVFTTHTEGWLVGQNGRIINFKF